MRICAKEDYFRHGDKWSSVLAVLAVRFQETCGRQGEGAGGRAAVWWGKKLLLRGANYCHLGLEQTKNCRFCQWKLNVCNFNVKFPDVKC